jgi:hypothetical protein
MMTSALLSFPRREKISKIKLQTSEKDQTSNIGRCQRCPLRLEALKLL